MATVNNLLETTKRKRKTKMGDVELGKLTRTFDEIVKRIDAGGLSFNETMELFHGVVMHNKTAEHLKIVRRTHHIVQTRYMMDGNAIHPGTVPGNWKVVTHQKNGKLEWRPGIITVSLEDGQRRNTNFPYGEQVYESYAGEKLPNSNMLEFYLKHPYLIPDEWKGEIVHFFGTIFTDDRGNLHVRRLEWNGSKHKWEAGTTMFEKVFFAPNMVVATFSKN